MRTMNKFLLTPDTYFHEKLGERHTVLFAYYFSLWSGVHSPFFKIKQEHVPIRDMIVKIPE